MSYETLADMVLVLHFAYVAFVFFGQLLIVAGCVFRWQWVRNVWFRAIHLVAILLVVIRSLFLEWCPLTTWEGNLRFLDHRSSEPTTAVGRLFQTLIGYNLGWPASTFFVIYAVFAVLVVLTLVVAPPRRKAC